MGEGSLFSIVFGWPPGHRHSREKSDRLLAWISVSLRQACIARVFGAASGCHRDGARDQRGGRRLSRQRSGRRIGAGTQSGERVAVVPGHPLPRLRFELGWVALELDEVVEGIDLGQFGGVDQAHEQVADIGAVLGLIEQGVLAVQDGLLEHPFTDIIVERGAGLAQEQRELRPVLAQVLTAPPSVELGSTLRCSSCS